MTTRNNNRTSASGFIITKTNNTILLILLLLLLQEEVIFMNRNMNPLKHGVCQGFMTIRSSTTNRLHHQHFNYLSSSSLYQRKEQQQQQERRLSSLSFSTTSSRSRSRKATIMDTALCMVNTANNDVTSMSTTTSSSDASETTTMIKKKTITRRILSGVQPTGTLHLGNYLGALRQWVDFQDNSETLNELIMNQERQEQQDQKLEGGVDEKVEENINSNMYEYRTENYFCVVDLHAITLPHDPIALYESTLSSAALYIASGIDPNKSKIFVQSHVPQHTELTWLLSCITPMNWLERMIQYKDKSKKTGSDNVGVGLFTYPILMASDILLYQATHVPVGEDQRQHLELTRDIVRRFHDIFTKGNQYKKRCKEYNVSSRLPFIEPNAIIMKDTGRIMSLSDGTNKMSKSDTNDNSRINLLDPPDIIRTKIKKCKTDEYIGIEYNNPNRPEATNLLNIYMAVHPNGTTSTGRIELINHVSNMTWGEFKPLFSNTLIEHLQPIQDKYYNIRSNETYLKSILYDGAKSASIIASDTLYKTRIAMGFVLPTSTSTTPSSQ